jgi:uncharacterized protein
MISDDFPNSHPTDGLIVFLRTPEAGKVKSRIAKTLGASLTLKIYRELISITLTRIVDLDCGIYLYFYPTIDHTYLYDTRFIARIQKGADLGLRMWAALEEVLRTHSKAVLIGTDCPYLTSGILKEAFKRLDEHDLVIGPAIDGGYYLIGLRHSYLRLFTGIEWSTDRVLSQTLQAARDLNLSYSLLAQLADIDHEEDWRKYVNQR